MLANKLTRKNIQIEKEKLKNIIKDENINFYDIESLDNVFTLANYKNQANEIDIYYLVDDPQFDDNESALLNDVRNAIYDQNLNFTGKINLYNLKNPTYNIQLARTFGLSDSYNPAIRNDNNYKTDQLGEMYLTMDIEPGYDKSIHPYLMGYNSSNYDLTMLTYYLYETFNVKVHPLKIIKDLTPNEQEMAKNAYDLSKGFATGAIYQLENKKQVQGNLEVVNGEVKFTYPNPLANQTYINIAPPTARSLRNFNNELFSKDFIDNMSKRLEYNSYEDKLKGVRNNYRHPMATIRRNMLLSGRHLDVSKLNEKQSKVGLKRLMGMLGLQILESDKLDDQKSYIDTREEFLDLIAYNVSDVVNLEILFSHKVYKTQFDLKRDILRLYPELIYQKKDNAYEPDINQYKVRQNRLNIDSTSAKFAELSLAPYGPLNDIEFVSFNYPSQKYIDMHPELNIKQFNVLDWVRDNFYEMFPQQELRNKFNHIYNYYKSIEGKNFNGGKTYHEKYGNKNDIYSLKTFKDPNLNLPYYFKDGTPSSCFITFSTGGAHGQEANKVKLNLNLDKYHQLKEDIAYAKAISKDNPYWIRKEKEIKMPKGEIRKWNYFLKSGATLKDPKKSKWKDIKYGLITEPFPVDKNTKLGKLDKRLVYTSSDLVNHEDFKSYYPLLLTNLAAFYNEGLGYDRYNEFFEAKELNGKRAKDKSYTEDERAAFALLQAGNKLILNSASGKADSEFDSNIRMNNTIISMRIIGQLFTYMIGQAQTYAGAKITSTNTDGLYSHLEETLNNKILEEESAKMNILIEPERMYLVSKDSNNRLELSEDCKIIYGAGGSDLSCYKGPNPAQSLDHPAIQDWALTEYFRHLASNNIPFSEEFDENLAYKIYEKAKTEFDDITYLNMFQNMVSSSSKSYSYVYSTDPKTKEKIKLQKYNRIFNVKETTKDAIFIEKVLAKKLTPAIVDKRKRLKERPIQHNPIALSLLSNYGLDIKDIPDEREATFEKVSNIDTDQYVLIENHALNQLSDDYIKYLKDNLNISIYVRDLRNTFEKNWQNEIDNDYEDRIRIYGKQ